MKPLFPLITSLAITSALLVPFWAIPKREYGHVLSKRVDWEGVNDIQYPNEHTVFDEQHPSYSSESHEQGDMSAVEDGPSYWRTVARSQPDYATTPGGQLLDFGDDSSVSANMGADYRPFDKDARYISPQETEYDQSGPGQTFMGYYPESFGDGDGTFGELGVSSDVFALTDHVKMFQPTSFQYSIDQQVTATEARISAPEYVQFKGGEMAEDENKDIGMAENDEEDIDMNSPPKGKPKSREGSSRKDAARHTFDPNVPVPQGMYRDRTRKYDPKKGVPVLSPTSKIKLWVTAEGAIRDDYKKLYNPEGQRLNLGKVAYNPRPKIFRTNPNLPVPEGYKADPSRDYDQKLGAPITSTTSKRHPKLWLSDAGKVRDGHKRIYDKSNMGHKQKREDILGAIQKASAVSSANGTTSLQAQQAQFQNYLNTYYAVQSKVSALVLPLIQEIIKTTNNTNIYDVATGAYIEIAGLPISISGPFIAGTNCISWLQTQYFNGTNSSLAAIAAKPRLNRTTNEINTLQHFASYEKLLSVYNYAYYNGSAAANSTGLLGILQTLKKHLMANDTSIMPKEFTDVNTKYIAELFPHRNISISS